MQMILPSILPESSISLNYEPVQLLDSIIAQGVLWQVALGRFLLDVPGVARYLVENGTSITIDSASGGDADKVKRFLRMTPLAALIYQRGLLAIHAAAVSTEYGAIVIAGDSGVGKSALTVKLVQMGYKILADELTIVSIDTITGKPVVHPTWPQAAVWPVAAKKLGIETDGLPMFDSNRVSLDLSNDFESQAQPLKAIYRLSVSKGDKVELSEVVGAKRFSTLTSITYNTQIADAIIDKTCFLRIGLNVIKNLHFMTLSRPKDISLDLLTSSILQDLV